ncbi:tyrosyl-tRNA synthetase putative (TyrS) [Leptomonas pyrrhocoris]|uniref:tyrosine--tRNA ligase n=1 Tax=Leptomonas pyrrhocoris TaxID=157538 RepID=A0A0M9FWK1_LEPPY|nr:tyrosyl-tRNA synthetase putative (TyrS) [Leptomonas pyrrhocoris]XP_015655805.1 tyrosyl-tRNA synthetase putative (TyrS) [Leptomonas pyrrhocoris]KPA77365.1 tyrosyl-tRNA synthetase putative (TyrS) [Leptomonas pyrrhocoris]KPA77366.1 tyrosyl-tRNA synthetase putative (TyrS) [Leptomonas pyrrhocoris]|eukprot:XP_015655804.1 tyrosyl-tRNA synthetase putative (TyrS) [Leptomonas pyrrhocoris]
MNNDERYALLRSVGEECIQENELRNLIAKKPNIRCYDGFEPSGRMHIAQGIFKAVNVNKCTAAGCEFVFWVADWFALMNDKVGGELEKIGVVGRYLIEVWKAAGMDMEKVVFLWSSKEITSHADVYWRMALDVGRQNTIARIKKCCTIMGKVEGTLTAAQILYPLMQCTDIFFLKADICQLGLDQRKVNMLAREYCDVVGRKLKPVILSHHMLAGLKQGQAKMSKSDPDSAIFMEDTEEDVARKINQAYCPRVAQAEQDVTDDGAPVATDDRNPVLDYYRCIVYARPGEAATINGVRYTTYEDLESAFVKEQVSEAEVKQCLIDEVNALLAPVRQHFATNAEAHELLEAVKSFRKGGAASPLAETQLPPGPEKPHACMWMPALLKVPLDVAEAMVEAAKSFLAAHPDGSVTLILPDWSAVASDEITGVEKDISAALEVNSALLHSYGLPAAVKIVKENDVILANSNDYWVGVISVGRKNLLSHIEELYGGEVKNAGQVIAALMRVATALLLSASHVISTSLDGQLNTLSREYTKERIECLQTHEGSIPPLHRPDAAPALLGADDVLYLDDGDMDIRRKIKKAYSAPNESANPVVAIAQHLLTFHGPLSIERGEANGGSVTYEKPEAIAADCGSGALHPADLKAAVSKALLERSAPSRALLSGPLKKSLTVLRNAEKKMTKKK